MYRWYQMISRAAETTTYDYVHWSGDENPNFSDTAHAQVGYERVFWILRGMDKVQVGFDHFHFGRQIYVMDPRHGDQTGHVLE